MCLDIVFKDTVKPKKGYKVGKRVLDESLNRFSFSFMRGDTPFDTWVISGLSCAESSGVHIVDDEYKRKQTAYTYFPGFHILTSLEDAKVLLQKKKNDLACIYPDYRLPYKYEIYECEYIGVLAEGFESWNLDMKTPMRVDVAAMIKINSIPVSV